MRGATQKLSTAALLHSLDGNRTDLYDTLYAQQNYHANPQLTHSKGIIQERLIPHFRGLESNLDVGCSHGLGVQTLWNAGFIASGMDLANAAVSMATRLRSPAAAEACGGAPCFKQGSAAAIPWHDASFDAILSMRECEDAMMEDTASRVRDVDMRQRQHGMKRT